MRALVTGGAGFMGSHVTDYLIQDGYEVVVVDDLSGGFKENVNPQAKFLNTSITEPKVVDELFDIYHFDYIFHLAAYAAEGLSPFIRRFNYMNNLIGSINLINNAIRHSTKCFVFTSSIAVYGSGQTPMTEDMTPSPEDPYGIAKYAVELDLKAAFAMFGLNYIVFRPHNVYGERQNIGDPYRNVIGIFMNQIMQGCPCTVFGDGSQTRAFTHIADVAPVIARSVKVLPAYNQIFNVGADKPYTVNSLVKSVSEAMGIGFPGVVNLPPRKEVLHAFSDHSKIKKVFGLNSQVSLASGLKRMSSWVKVVGARKGKSFGNLEVYRGLPESWRKRGI